MKEKNINQESIRITNEILKKSSYNISFNDLISKLIKKEYKEDLTNITYNVTKALSNSIEILTIDPFTYSHYNI